MVLDPLAQLDAVTTGAVVVIFLVTLLLLRRTCFLPLIEVMEKRLLRIETARAGRMEAEGFLKDARLRAEGLLAAAGDEAARIAGAAKEERTRTREARMALAGAEAEALLARGREGVLALTRSEEAQLAEDLHDCVVQILSKMIDRVDDRTVRFMVNKALAAKEAR